MVSQTGRRLSWGDHLVSSKGTISLPGDLLVFLNEAPPPSRRPFGLPQRGAASLEETIWPSPTQHRLFSDTVWVSRAGSRDLRRVFRCLFGLFSARLPVLRGFAERIDGPKRGDGRRAGRRIFSVYRSQHLCCIINKGLSQLVNRLAAAVSSNLVTN